jgi:hypothetical protein
MTTDLSNTNLVNLISNKKLVYNNQANLPASYIDSDFKIEN